MLGQATYLWHTSDSFGGLWEQKFDTLIALAFISLTVHCCLVLYRPIFLRIMGFCQQSSHVLMFQLMTTHANISSDSDSIVFCVNVGRIFIQSILLYFADQNMSHRHVCFWESGLSWNRKCCSLLTKKTLVNVLCSPSILQQWENASKVGYQVCDRTPCLSCQHPALNKYFSNEIVWDSMQM